MKKSINSIALTCLFFAGYAQNTGINTTDPQASLDVRGTQRVGGINNYIRYDSATGRIEWVGAALYVPASQQIIRHSASSEGLYAGGGRLEYRNTSNPVFYSDWTTGNGYFKNRLGINNVNPQFPISLDGNLGDKLSLWTDGSSTHYGFGVQSGLLQIFSKLNTDDIAFGYGSSSAFTERMRIKGNGNVGIGISTPNSPLSFPPALGRKISLYPGATGNVGMSVLGNLFQIYSDNPIADIAFGYDQAGAMVERMRIKGNGNVGIGNTDPGYFLDVNGRMRIRSGGNNNTTAGMWLNNNSNTEAAFVGMEDDAHVGFFGNNGAGWKFAMNTQTGAIAVNGNDGAAGQLMQSNGAAGAAQWASIASALPSYYIYNSVGGAIYADVNGPGEFPLPNGTINFSVASNSRVIVSANYAIYTQCPAIGSCSGHGRFYFKMDGNSTYDQFVEVQNGGAGAASGSLANYFYDVGPGSHSLVFYVTPDPLGSSRFYGYLGTATIIIMRQ
jgi:hypothetical protein